MADQCHQQMPPIRALRKKLDRITQMEESLSQSKSFNKEQEEVLFHTTATIEAREASSTPLSCVVSNEINLAIQHHQAEIKNLTLEEKKKTPEGNNQLEWDQGEKGCDWLIVEDFLNLFYFGSVFDAKTLSYCTKRGQFGLNLKVHASDF